MSAKYSEFKFKRFAVCHEYSGMKVGTDGVLLGAWADLCNCGRVWDVGCGSGLIALMVAQRSRDALIDAIDIEEGAVVDARKNIVASGWSDRMAVHHGDINMIACDLVAPDIIVSNPPFFQPGVDSPSAVRKLARTESGLSCESLVMLAARFLGDKGRLCMITPASRRQDVEWQCVLHRLNVARLTNVATVRGKTPTRILWDIRREVPGNMQEEILSLRECDGRWTDEYVDLTREFYLNF